jgi:hypothetical protein
LNRAQNLLRNRRQIGYNKRPRQLLSSQDFASNFFHFKILRTEVDIAIRIRNKTSILLSRSKKNVDTDAMDEQG